MLHDAKPVGSNYYQLELHADLSPLELMSTSSQVGAEQGRAAGDRAPRGEVLVDRRLAALDAHRPLPRPGLRMGDAAQGPGSYRGHSDTRTFLKVVSFTQ